MHGDEGKEEADTPHSYRSPIHPATDFTQSGASSGSFQTNRAWGIPRLPSHKPCQQNHYAGVPAEVNRLSVGISMCFMPSFFVSFAISTSLVNCCNIIAGISGQLGERLIINGLARLHGDFDDAVIQINTDARYIITLTKYFL